MKTHCRFITSDGDEVEVDADQPLRRGTGTIVARDAHPDMTVALRITREWWEGKRKFSKEVEVTASRVESDWRSALRNHTHGHGWDEHTARSALALDTPLRVVSTERVEQREHTSRNAVPKGRVRLLVRGYALLLEFGGGETSQARNAAHKATKRVVEARLLSAGLQDELVRVNDEHALVFEDERNAQLAAWVARGWLQEQGWYATTE